ncbi:mechanosensitive ion channel family protein [Pedobacter suwonensis]|uniref:mechanosensitive ion channel family protein n=1 Tax=Pedobacter suwonensis TaxID=332999 RepID=UPI0036D0C3C3
MPNPLNLNLTNIESNWSKLSAKAIDYAPRIATAIISAVIILLFGLWMIKIINKIISRVFEKQNVDISLRRFLSNLTDWSLKILLFIIVITQLGVQTSAFIAMIGAAGLAIGLALQGSLSNFAGGVLILTLRPFKIGDYISASSGVSGTVMLIDIFNTKLRTPQNQLLVVPNGILSNSSITNFTELGTRRTWFDIGVSYNTDLNKAKDILLNTIAKNELAYKDPSPEVVVTTLGTNTINLSVRATTGNENFWTMNEQLIIDCKNALDAGGIEIPFAQTDVYAIGKKSH